MMHQYNGADSDVAIIGMSGRFPGAQNIDDFWKNLCDGVESITPLSEGQLRTSLQTSLGYVPESLLTQWLQDPHFVKAGAGLDDIDLFDAAFFGYTPAEATLLDPQQRLFLECAWEALEHAGYDSETYNGLIGVYAGTEMSTYHHDLHSCILPTERDLLTLLGNSGDYLTTRVSYKLNLKGPSFAIQSACSTSLVAVHIACQSLKCGECDMALAGGVTAYTTQKMGYFYQEGGMFSPDGHCRPFDAEAQGTVFANGGIGVIVLKRLADALTDGDTVYAIIKGSATNNDGSVKAGYTAPGIAGQARVFSEALSVAHIDPASISYIEAHGTGTPLGDPIEIASLIQVFRRKTQKYNFCAIGSVKSNIGHLGAAAGIAGLIKTTLALYYKKIPPSLYYKRPNPQIDFTHSPFYVNDKLADWNAGSTPLRAGVNSLGIGGSNAHVLLEEVPVNLAHKSCLPESHHLLILSSKTGKALETSTVRLIEYLKLHPDSNLANVAYTLQVGRRAFMYRRITVCHDSKDAIEALEKIGSSRVYSAYQETRNPPVVFMFPGGGAQYVNMGRDLYLEEPLFRKHVDRCIEILKPQLGMDLRCLLYPEEGEMAIAAKKLTQPLLGLPALFTISYALAQLWISWGVHPKAMIGHSLGEYAAACLANVFTLEDALSLVVLRGRLFEQLPAGAMLSVPLPVEQIHPFLGTHLSIAAVNAPSLCVVSGPIDDIESLSIALNKNGIETRNVQISVAAHSSMIESILDDFRQFIEVLPLQKGTIPYISNVTGTWITPAEMVDPLYWTRHLRQTVYFATGISTLLQEPGTLFLEVGPGQTLSSLVKQCGDKPARQIVLSSTRHPREQQSDRAYLLTTAGRLWLGGVQIDWEHFSDKEYHHRLPLPTYPFERQRYWMDPLQKELDGHSRHDGKKLALAEWFSIPSWKRTLSPLRREHTEAQQGVQWLVFCDTCGVGTMLVERLEKEGIQVIVVWAAGHFAQLSEHVYTLNPGQSDDYDALLAELVKKECYPQKTLFLWNVTSSSGSYRPTLPNDEELEISQNLGFYSLLFFAQALGKQGEDAPVQIWAVSNNMQEVTGEDLLYPEKATILGPCKIIPQENPSIACCSLDIVLPTEDWRKTRLIDQLIDEFFREPSDPLVAYRGHHRYVQTFESLHIGETQGSPLSLRAQGVYLITGGLGGLGLVLAEYLAQCVQAKLVLIGRSAFPERADWYQWLSTHEEQDPISQKIRQIQKFEEFGAEIFIVKADVSDQQQMHEVITQTYQRFAAIHGVIHAAGIASGRIIQMKTREEAERVFSPKLKGTITLANLFKDTPLDFLLLCSSITSVLGDIGQVDHCGANAFLDAFAYWKTAQDGMFTLAINWDAWQEVGQAARANAPLSLKAIREERLKLGILPAEGVDVFKRALNSKLSQVLVSTIDFRQREKRVANQVHPSEEAVYPPAYAGTRPELAIAYVAPRNEIERVLATIWQQLFSIDQIGIYDSFYDLGGHSLLATKLISRVRSVFQLELPLARILELHTIEKLATYIEEMLIRKIEELPEEEAQRLIQNTLSSS